MPNGRNAGRLFADCENEYGHGASHSILDENDLPVDMRERRTEPLPVRCRRCGRRFMLRPSDNKLEPV